MPRLPALLVSLALLAWGWLVLLQAPSGPSEVAPGLRLYLPAGAPPWPAVLVLHSVFQDSDTAESAARAAARRGWVGAQVVLRSGGTFEEHLEACRAALRRLQADPRVARVAAYGHSMGADLAVSLARDEPSVEAVMAVGFPVEADPERPRCLALAVGAWDELHPVAAIRAAARGRQVVVLPAADHPAETVDPAVFEAAFSLFARCWGVSAAGPAPLWPDPFLARGMVALGSFLPLVASLSGVRGRARAGVALLGCAVGAAVLPRFVAGGLAAALLATASGSWPSGRLLVRLGLVVAVAGAALAVNSWASVAEDPFRLAGLAQWALQAPAFWASRLAGAVVGPLGAAWLLVELAFPGRLAAGLSDLHARLVGALRTLDLRPRLEVSPASALVLLLCLGAAGVAWVQVSRAGYAMDMAEVARLAGILARLVLLPAVLMAAAVRSRAWG